MLVEFKDNVTKWVCLNKPCMIYYCYMFVQWYSFPRRTTGFIILFSKSFYSPTCLLCEIAILFCGEYALSWPPVSGAMCICFVLTAQSTSCCEDSNINNTNALSFNNLKITLCLCIIDSNESPNSFSDIVFLMCWVQNCLQGYSIKLHD